MKRLPLPIARYAMVIAILGDLDLASGDVELWQLGGDSGHVWNEFTDPAANILMDDVTVPTALQPRELDPEVNILPQLGPWHNVKFPPDFRYRDGQPRIWRGINYWQKRIFFPGKFVDGDPNTADVHNPLVRIDWEFYTIDVGGRIPAERFRFYPPDGIDHINDVPYRPFYNPAGFELSAGNDALALALEAGDVHNEDRYSSNDYHPLEVVLFTTRQHYEPTGVIDIDFSLQYHRFFRIRAFPESTELCKDSGIGLRWRDKCIRRLAWAEMEIYGRGFVPEATWESQVVDLGESFNFGRVIFGTSTWRRDDGQLAPAPDEQARIEVELRTGSDDDPVAHYGFNSRGGHVQVTADEYEDLRVGRPEVDPKLIGWRGPIAHDHENWSFYSAPMRESGTRPRAPKGRYFQVRVKLQTDELWAFTRLDSLALEISPLLADEILGEITASDDMRPGGGLAKVRAGEMTEFVYDVRAEFTGEEKPGFDAVRLLTPSHAEFRGLEMGDPLVAVVPDEVIAESTGFTVYLPRKVSQGEPPLRIRLESALYGASGTFAGEVFERESVDLPQAIEAGDVSEQVGTNRLQVVAIPSSLGDVLGAVVVEPAIFTPQGDGVNEKVRISYSMLRLREGVQVEVGVYALSGKRVWAQQLHKQAAGRHSVPWDGRDDQGALVPPGIYLTRVKVATSKGAFERLQRVAVVY